jgi:hypothetical protein
MVHAADADLGVPDAGRDAGAQHRHDHHVFVGDVVLARQHLDRVVLEVVVAVEE